MSLFSALEPKIKLLTLLIFSALPFYSVAQNNFTGSFNKAKKILEKEVYQHKDERKTLYCNATFNSQKKITDTAGFHSDKYKKRGKKLEWEHVVPAENFGRNFKPWREGDKQCVTGKGKNYKGRQCANKVDQQYRYMQADMYNLYPAIGAVNALRSNYNFSAQVTSEQRLGDCDMQISNRKVQPPSHARGIIARTYLYMDSNYQDYQMSQQQKKLMLAWHKTYPVSHWECERAERIEKIQGNQNQILRESCTAINKKN